MPQTPDVLLRSIRCHLLNYEINGKGENGKAPVFREPGKTADTEKDRSLHAIGRMNTATENTAHRPSDTKP